MIYDIIIIGTSPLAIFEAFYRSQKGENILMIDKSNSIGGAWKSISLSGINDIENAIHYLMPNNNAFKFFEENLKLKISKTLKKKSIYDVPLLGKIVLNYDSFLTRVIKLFYKEKINASDFRRLFNQEYHSRYFENGSPALIERISQMILISNIKVELNNEVSKIHIDKTISIYTKRGKIFKSKEIICSNGSRIRNLIFREEQININEKIQLRPSVHLVIRDKQNSKINEAIFLNNNLIKYVHDVTKYAQVKKQSTKIFVIALQHEISENKEVYVKIHEVLKDVGITSSNSKIIEVKWTNVVLPRLFNKDLQILREKIGGQFNYLKTESITHAIDDNYEKWKSINLNYEKR